MHMSYVLWSGYQHDHDFPADSAVPLDLVRQALRELPASQRKRAESVTWQRWEQALEGR